MFSGGDAQLANGSPSIEHSNSASGSLLANANVTGVGASCGTSAGGPLRISVSGAVRSLIVHS